ncbi:MAG TPA: hypothetical protein VJ327_08790 [Patescibacteria group bacterium]|nr:hypothetical protein [Patescibacteria group bacterium]
MREREVVTRRLDILPVGFGLGIAFVAKGETWLVRVTKNEGVSYIRRLMNADAGEVKKK